MIHGLADVHFAERPQHKITVGLIAAHIFRPGALYFQDGNGKGIEIAAQGHVAALGKNGHVVQIDAADGGVVFRFVGVFKADLKAFFVPPEDFLHRDGLAVIIPLQLGAADFLQEFHLFFLFHALADGFHAQAHAHFHQLGQDNAVFFAAAELLHEAHIEFDQVEMDILQHIQGGIAAAEIVHPHLKAQLLEAGDLLFDKLEIAAHDAFGDFDGQLGSADVRLVHPAADFLHDIAAFKVRPGQVQGRGHHIQAHPLLPLHLFQDLVQHVQIQLVNQLGFLQHGNELGGRQEALRRVDPAGQRFFVAHPAVGCADDGLIVHLDPALGKRLVQIAGNVLPSFRFGQHLAVKKGVAGHNGVSVQVAGDLRPVTRLADLDFGICQEDTGTHRQIVALVEALGFFKQAAKPFLDPLGLGKHGKMILAEPGAAFAAEMRGQHMAKVQNQLIPGGKAVFAVEGFHAAQVDKQNGGFLPMGQHAFQARFRQFKKVGHVGQAGEGIIMVLAHHAFFPHHAVKGTV